MISNLPLAMQAAIQEGYLAKQFEFGLIGNRVFSGICDVQSFPMRVGETITRTRVGLRAPNTTPIAPSANTGLDNGITLSQDRLEQYSMSLNFYGDGDNINMVDDGVAIANTAVVKSKTLGIQAIQSKDRLARFKLDEMSRSGNTVVKTTLGAPATTVAVDDITGFEYVLIKGAVQGSGIMVPVSASHPLTVTIADGVYSLVGVTADVVNVSKRPRGVSGTLTFSANVVVLDGTAGNAVKAAFGSTVIRPSGKKSAEALVSTDRLTFQMVLDAATELSSNAVPMIDGAYNCYITARHLRQLFLDPEFQLLYRGAHGAAEIKSGQVTELAGLRFIVTTEADTGYKPGSIFVSKAYVVGADALVEGRFAGQSAGTDTMNESIITENDGIIFLVNSGLDRAAETIRMTWKMRVGFAAPTDQLADASVIPTASNAAYKRQVLIETAA